MNLWEKILEKSGLPECRSIAEHICTGLSKGINTVYIKNESITKVNELDSVHLQIDNISQISTVMFDKPVLNTKIYDLEDISTKVYEKPIIKIKIECPC